MTEIITSVDAYSTAFFDGYTSKHFGFCELMHKTSSSGSDQPIPVTIPLREQVSLDDRYQVITWVRWQDQVRYQESEDWSFGIKPVKIGVLPLRLVLAHRVELGEDVVFDYVNEFPDVFDNPNFKYINVEETPTIDPNHESIYNTELGKTVYEKHRFTWNLYVINFSVEFLSCDGNIIRITEAGEYRVTENSETRILE